MNAPILSRRDFTAGLGAIVAAFSLNPELAHAQQPANLPGSLNSSRTAEYRNPRRMPFVIVGSSQLHRSVLTPAFFLCGLCESFAIFAVKSF